MMKSLPQHISEKLVVFHPQIDEKLVVNKDYNSYLYHPKIPSELRWIIENRYKKFGHGTKKEPVDFNDIDVSGITTFFDESRDIGIFEDTRFEYIDVSDWNVSKCTDFRKMFFRCLRLVSVGDLSDWNMSSAKKLSYMFGYCNKLEQIGDLSNWNIKDIEWCNAMFIDCESLSYIGDLSNWNISTASINWKMFYGCKKLTDIGDITKWRIFHQGGEMFAKSGIKLRPIFVI